MSAITLLIGSWIFFMIGWHFDKAEPSLFGMLCSVLALATIFGKD